MIKKQLNELKTEIQTNHFNALKINVIDILTDRAENEIKGFIGDVLQNGCVSGIVSELIYYKDTNDFYDKYEQEIEDLITEQMDEQGIEKRSLFIGSLNGDSENMTQEKNLLCWFAVEEVMREINHLLLINKDYI